jgi:hypothetical protein
MRHFLLAVLYSGCLSIFFGSMLRDAPRDCVRFGLKLFGIMVGSVFLLGWLMALLGR